MGHDLILFDLDDTLVDFGGAAKAALRKVLEDSRAPLDAAVEARFGVINESLWRRFEAREVTKEHVFTARWETLFRELGLPVDAQAVNAYFLDQLVEHTEAFPGAVDVVRLAARRAKVAAVTNGHSPTQHRRIARAGLAEHLATCIVSDAVGVGKPHPEIFLAALAATGVARDARVLMVGDNLKADVGGALAMGFDACWVSGGRAHEGPHVPTFTVTAVAELVNLLAE